MKKRLVLILGCMLGVASLSAAWSYWKGRNTPQVVKPLPQVRLDESPLPAALKSNKAVALAKEAREVIFAPGGRFSFPIGPKDSVVVLVQEVKTSDDGSLSSMGNVEGQPASQAIFVMVGDAVAGSVDLADGRTFTLNFVAPGIHRLSEVDHAKAHDCDTCRGKAGPDAEELKALPPGVQVAFDGASTVARRNGQAMRMAVRKFALRAGPTKRGKQQAADKEESSDEGIYRKSKFAQRQAGKGAGTGDGQKQGGGSGAGSSSGKGGSASTSQQGTASQSKTNGAGGLTNGSTAGAGTNLAGGATKKGGNQAGAGSGGGGGMESKATLELMVLYTPGAAKMFGGADGIKARIQVAVEGANKTLDNSRIAASITLVHAGAVDYTSQGSKSKDLMNMAFGSHPLREQVRKLRAAHHADIVTLVTETDGGGVGFLLNQKKTTPSIGFNVVCGNSLHDSVLAHEMGHNLGCQHAPGDPGAGGAMFDYANGHRFQANDGTGSRQYRTVMAYAPGARVKYFSNPEVKLFGVPTGTAAGADNARVINQTAALVAKNSDE